MHHVITSTYSHFCYRKSTTTSLNSTHEHALTYPCRGYKFVSEVLRTSTQPSPSLSLKTPCAGCRSHWIRIYGIEGLRSVGRHSRTNDGAVLDTSTFGIVFWSFLLLFFCICMFCILFLCLLWVWSGPQFHPYVARLDTTFSIHSNFGTVTWV